MENSNTDYQNQGSSNTRDKNYRVTSVVPNNYKQRSNFATFGIVLLIFLIVGGAAAVFYFLGKDKIDSVTDELIKTITDEFSVENDSDKESGTSGGIHISPDDINIETPSVDMPDFDEIQGQIEESLRKADELRGRDTEIDMDDYLSFDAPSYLKTSREVNYGRIYTMDDSDADSILQVSLFAIAGETDASAYAKSRIGINSDKTVETYKANGLTWYGLETASAFSYKRLYTQVDGKVFELEIYFSKDNANKVDEIISSIEAA